MIAYNLTETIISHTVVETREDTKYEYKVNFSAAAHVCRVFLRLRPPQIPEDIMTLIGKKLIPIRNERSVPRLKTAHFMTPKYFVYMTS